MSSLVAEALLEGIIRERKQQVTLGLARLLEHYGLESDLSTQASDLGLTADLSHPYVALLAWGLVGPKIAEENKIYKGVVRGAPSKKGFSKDVERALFVERVRSGLAAGGLQYSDASIISAAKDFFELPLFSSSDLSLRNSVARGKRELAALRQAMGSHHE